MTVSTAIQNPFHDPCPNAGIGCRASCTNRYTSEISTAPVTYLRSTRTQPSGRSASTVVMTPPPRMYAQRGTASPIWCSAVPMVTSSNVVQPMSCTMLSTVGRYDARVPNRPRSNTIDGDPVTAPGWPAAATPSVPSTVPTTSAVVAAASDIGRLTGTSTKIALVNPRMLTPRLPHSAPTSNERNVRWTGSASVAPTSAVSARWAT